MQPNNQQFCLLVRFCFEIGEQGCVPIVVENVLSILWIFIHLDRAYSFILTPPKQASCEPYLLLRNEVLEIQILWHSRHFLHRYYQDSPLVFFKQCLATTPLRYWGGFIPARLQVSNVKVVIRHWTTNVRGLRVKAISSIERRHSTQLD